jgi:hypothetical protein
VCAEAGHLQGEIGKTVAYARLAIDLSHKDSVILPDCFPALFVRVY